MSSKIQIDESAWVDKSAALRGSVTLGPEVGVWCNAVLRGIGMNITVGRRSNVQDCVVIHGDIGHDVVIGERVSLGHGAVIHGCTIEDNCVIGMGSVVLDHAVIGAGSIVGAGAVVPAGMQVPPGSLVVGLPGKIKKQLGLEALEDNIRNAEEYWKFALEQKALEQE
ncbi:MAG: gamma carbonic anhydrase family protein [Firmicutes bacterium]|nr:gamma carbonic anhydrase family protein [Bacillota bacterium]